MKQLFLLLMVLPMFLSAKVVTPAPCGPVPSARQLAWHELGFYAFVHFTTTTYRDLEWGYGDATPDEFNPIHLDCEQWVKTLKSAGMKGVIITAKHHDGFCLWPSKFTDYSVKNSAWREGKGDVLAELSKAAKKYGLRFGVYLSPWDRHDERYGSPAYVDYFRNQLRELLTQYGPIFEVWQDGANGGDGYYGGKKEKRSIDARTYYGWDITNSIIRQLQPQASIFSDSGPDTRWCGTEQGFAGDPNWATITRRNYLPGAAKMEQRQHGEENGPEWVPAEVDVSIRPGWFFHEKENSKVKTVEQLMDIYYNSIGRGANLILNVPANKEGLFHPIDVQRLADFGAALKKEFQNDLTQRIQRVEATNIRGNKRTWSPKRVLDKNHQTYWATDDGITSASLTFQFRDAQPFNRFSVREFIALGQRVKGFKLEYQLPDGNWKEIVTGTTIGNRRLLRFPTVTASRVRFSITAAKACPLISDIHFYLSDLPYTPH